MAGNKFFESVTQFWGLATALADQSCVCEDLRIDIIQGMLLLITVLNLF
jgi:hypothetical protein